MKVKLIRTVLIVIPVLVLAVVFMVSTFAAPGSSEWVVDENGNLTVDGQPFIVKGGAWFGLEGRHEPSNDPDNPSGAPMELYIGNTFWAPSGRTHEKDIAEFKELGFNAIRIPLVHQTLDPDDPQNEFKKNAPEVVYPNAYEELCDVIKMLDAAGIYVLLDVHSCSNYVGWRAGRLDARPPYTDNIRQDYDYMRENCSCSSTGNPSGVTIIQPYNQSTWTADLKKLAGLSSELGVDNIMGIDIFNEPWDYSWSEWKSLIESAYKTINAVDPNILIFAQGVSDSNGNQDGTPDTKNDTPHGNLDSNPNWGENLYDAGDDPPNVPKSKLVYSPHTYGPSVFVQKMFMDPAQPECEGLSEEDAAENECQIVINPEILEPGWEEHFGYLKDLGYAIVPGEWGGNANFPDGAEIRKQKMFGYQKDKTVDWQWQQAFAKYLIKKGILGSFYWSINPESVDTGGIYKHAYDPVSNTAGWGTWLGVDQDKMNLLKSIWNATPPSNTPGKTPGTTPGSGSKGNVNGDSVVNIVDALAVAQYSVGKPPANFNVANADVNDDGKVNIQDALLIAQYTVNGHW